MIFDFQDIVNRVGVTGVIHVGGFVGEELKEYRECGLYNTLIFEPQPDLYEIIKEKCGDNESVFPFALGNKDSTEKMYVSETDGGIENGSGASSSLLKPQKHLTEHPQVKFTRTIDVEVVTLDWLMSTIAKVENTDQWNFLNIDVQGYELKVLQGAEKTLQSTNGLIVEVNRDEVYTDCAKIWEIDEFLEKRGFRQTKLVWQSESWGDALYEKD